VGTLTLDQERNLVRLCALAAKYRIYKAEDVMSALGIPELGYRKSRSDAYKKLSENYYKSVYGRQKTSQFLGETQGEEQEMPLAQETEDAGGLEDREYAVLHDTTISPALSELIISLKNLIYQLALELYGVNCTEPQLLKMTKETLKIISARIADIPIAGPVDAIDDYLRDLEQQGPPVQPGTKKKQETPKPAEPEVPTQDRNKLKRTPPWEIM